MAVNILKLIYELLRLLVVGLWSVNWGNFFTKCFEFLGCLVGYLGISLVIILLMTGVIVRLSQSLFLFYVCLSARWRPILLRLTPPEVFSSTATTHSSLLTPPVSLDQFSSGEEPLVFLQSSEVRVPYSCRLLLFIVTPVSNAWKWLRSSWPVCKLFAKCHFLYRWMGLKKLRKKLCRILRWLKIKTRVLTWFRVNVKQTQKNNGLVLEADLLLDEFFYLGLRITWLRTGVIKYGLKTPFRRGVDVKSSHAAVIFPSMIFLLFCWSSIILILFGASWF